MVTKSVGMVYSGMGPDYRFALCNNASSIIIVNRMITFMLY